MKKTFIFFSLWLISIILTGQDLNYANNIIQKLASEEFKGRGYVEKGDKIAAEYISSEYTKIGLESFKKDYFQYFKIDVNTFPNSISLKIDDELLQPGTDYLVDPVSSSINGKFEIYIVKKQDLLIDQKVKEVLLHSQNKFLVIDERDYKPASEEKKKLDELVGFLKYSPQVPTEGTIILSDNKLTWGASTIQSTKPTIILKKETDYEIGKIIEIKIDARLITNYKTQNVIGYIKGEEVPDTFIVLTAHYDHLGKMGKEVYFPGANDNASGVAMILNLAKYFKNNPPKYSIAFIALGAEELGILGAKYYTENPLFNLASIRFLVNFDLAGTGDDGIQVVNATVHKNEFNKLTGLNEASNYLVAIKARGAACNSDHCMFHEKHVPCFYIYTLGGIKAYHDIYDKYETLPLTEFEDYTNLMIDFMNHF